MEIIRVRNLFPLSLSKAYIKDNEGFDKSSPLRIVKVHICYKIFQNVDSDSFERRVKKQGHISQVG